MRHGEPPTPPGLSNFQQAEGTGVGWNALGVTIHYVTMIVRQGFVPGASRAAPGPARAHF